MSPAELADHWDMEAETARYFAESTRSLDTSVREYARASQLRQCAIQLRLVIAPAASPNGDQ